MKASIFDIDNCIAADEWRTPLIDFGKTDIDERYHRYHSKMAEDDFKNKETYFDWAEKSDVVAFLTSRPERYRKETQAWLNKHVIPKEPTKFVLVMREDGDHRRSVEVKAGLVKKFREACPEVNFPGDVIAAFDDRQDVVEMYRAFGIKCARVLAISHEQLPEPVALPGARPPELLRAAADLFEKRNGQYGNSYQRAGELIKAIFPEGGVPAMTTPEEMKRMSIILMCASKLQRYAHNLSTGGHKDSARDLQVYAAMLEEATL